MSGELWLTSGRRRANGSDIILRRALLIAAQLFLVAILMQQTLDPGRSWRFSWAELARAMSNHVEWFGATFAAAYAALYTRFSSQWSYLAGVYNQIKAAESQTSVAPGVIAQWRAGFIEDADDLHLVAKPIFASVVVHWARNKDVRQAFVQHTAGKRARLVRIVVDARRAYFHQEKMRQLTCTRTAGK